MAVSRRVMTSLCSVGFGATLRDGGISLVRLASPKMMVNCRAGVSHSRLCMVAVLRSTLPCFLRPMIAW